jgi:hypothetical protein
MSDATAASAPAPDPVASARTAVAAALAATTPRVPGRRGRPKGSVNGSAGTVGRRAAATRAATASPQAKTTAAVVLEGLTGLRSAPDAARALGVTVVRYYTVEAQAIAGLITACEPAASGPAPGAATEREVARLRQEHRRQEQELARLRAVLRTTQRSLGVAPVAPAPAPSGSGPTGPGKRRRARRPVVRALTVVRRLMAAQAGSVTAPAATAGASTVSTTPAASGTSSRGPGGG